MEKRGLHRLAWIGLSIALVAAALLTVRFLADPEANPGRFGLLVAMTILPVINALYDWLSYGLTRWLLRLNLARRSLSWRWLSGVIDFAGACILLAALAATMIVALEGFNAVGYGQGLQDPIAPVAQTLADIRLNGIDGQNAWIAIALFSTLLPSVLHLLIGVASAATVYAPGLDRRIFAAIHHVEQGDSLTDATRRQLSYLLALRWVVAVAAMLLACGVLYLIYEGAPFLADGLLAWSIDIQRWAAAFFATP